MTGEDNGAKKERQRRALEVTAGAWKDLEDRGAESQEAVEEFLREMRKCDDEREERVEFARHSDH